MATRRRITCNVGANEVLFPDSPIIVESVDGLDPPSAQGGIVVAGSRGSVRLTKKGRVATWSPDGPLTPGHHTLLVRGLVSAKRRGIADELRLPFFLTDSRAKVPRTVRVGSMVRLRVGELSTERLPAHRRPQGTFIELMKASHRTTGAPVALAYNQAGREIDADALLKRLVRRRLKKYGKLHPTLHDRMRGLSPRARVAVVIWLRAPEALEFEEKKTRGETKRPTREASARRKASAAVARRFAADLVSAKLAKEGRPDPLAPVVYAELTREQIDTVAADRDVLALFLHETEGLDDLTNSMGIANSDDVHATGVNGSGVKVAIWDNAPDDTTNLVIAARFKSSGLTTAQHARHTHGIVRNIEANAPHGHARSCSLHSANTKDLEALRWAANAGCTVISQSFHRRSEPKSDDLSFDDIYKDYLALHWPYPTICQAAGNYWDGDYDHIDPPEAEYVNHKGFNGLVVGNHDDTASAMSGSSVYRNPSSLPGDRELPEIAANGTDVTTVGLTMSGTSMASPAAAGVVALIQHQSPTLKSWPEGCRAIMLAGAKRNIAGNTWWQDVLGHVDAADGTGAVDALEAINIAKTHRGRNDSAARRGWDIGTLGSSDFSAGKLSTFAYRVRVPNFFFAPRHVKVALAWDSRVTTISIAGIQIPVSSTLTVDLDLMIYDSRGNLVGYSGSYDNSYEIAEFEGKPGETYDIRIRRWSGTDDTWYGISWTVTGGFQWADTTHYTVLDQVLSRRR